MKPVKDPLFDEWVIPYSCKACRSCWLIVEGKKRGHCVYGGYIDQSKGRDHPFMGYVNVEEEKAD